MSQQTFIFSKWTIEIPEQGGKYSVFIVNFEQILHLFLVFFFFFSLAELEHVSICYSQNDRNNDKGERYRLKCVFSKKTVIHVTKSGCQGILWAPVNFGLQNIDPFSNMPLFVLGFI